MPLLRALWIRSHDHIVIPVYHCCTTIVATGLELCGGHGSHGSGLAMVLADLVPAQVLGNGDRDFSLINLIHYLLAVMVVSIMGGWQMRSTCPSP